MKRIICAFILIMIITMVNLPIAAEWYEGEVIGVDLEEKTLVLKLVSGEEKVFKLGKDAELYYNNLKADLGMYIPVTANDFVSGYLEINEDGLVQTANFFYQVREGTIMELGDKQVILRETESGICDSYVVRKNVDIFLNNFPAKLENITPGMKVLLVLDYKFQVKKMAVFHYDYTGFIEELDLEKEIMVVNIGTRLNPKLKKFRIDRRIIRIYKNWEKLTELLKNKTLVIVKFLVDKEKNIISYMNFCSF
ncbi:hypothetical protein BBF96_11920 [Anoxybacter fermentans]|uniref:Uncharacterized protein n=1 Tax=Anoxybacter fermentans TaxID=1323375 RepID=A0A3Q9HRI7_9FIRM|nr:hypothetical protein [Anoxybacter fermentans]AZR74038.1 hypothetical protein BBF96_11920 [Anoxybacter fermentans]